MPSLSIVCANVYPEHQPIEFLLRNLAAQTFKSVEIVLVDAFFEENAELVRKLSQDLGLERVIHTPACEAKHVGRVLHWELYNNAALFANGDWLLFHGVHRYLHRNAVETVYHCAERSTCVVFFQLREDSEIERSDDFAEIERAYNMDVEQARWGFLQHSGFFSVPRDILINNLNGYNEAVVNVHWVDCDMGARVYHIPLTVSMAGRSVLRLERQGHYGVDERRNSRTVSGIGKPICTPQENPRCVCLLRGALTAENRHIDDPVNRFNHEGYPWVRCDKCGTLEIEDSDAYIHFLLNRPGSTRAPINVHGVGRNLARVNAELVGKSLEEKIDIVSKSHDNPIFLVP